MASVITSSLSPSARARGLKCSTISSAHEAAEVVAVVVGAVPVPAAAVVALLAAAQAAPLAAAPVAAAPLPLATGAEYKVWYLLLEGANTRTLFFVFF